MNVEEAIRRMNGYLQRRGSVDGSGGWTEQWLLDVLTDANQDFYHRVVSYGPDIFHRSTRFTYPADSESVVLKDKIGGRPMALWYVGILEKDQSVGPNNVPNRINMTRRTDLDSGGDSVDSFGSTSGIVDAAYASFNLTVTASSASRFDGYYLGEDLIFRPFPKKDVYVYVRWTPDRLPLLTDKEQELLTGLLPQFHSGIVLRAAMSAKIAKGEDVSQLERLYMENVGPHDSFLKMGVRSRQRQQPHQREPMRWEM
jgi:hypothetical protein